MPYEVETGIGLDNLAISEYTRVENERRARMILVLNDLIDNAPLTPDELKQLRRILRYFERNRFVRLDCAANYGLLADGTIGKF